MVSGATTPTSRASAAGGAPLRGLRFSLVGAGRVGSSLAAWAAAAGADLVGAAGRAEVDRLSTGGQDLLLIAVPDGALAEVAARLGERPQATVALHTSGSREAGVLAPLRAAGSEAGAMHPLKAFPRALPELEQARGVFFGLDGDAAAIRLARRLVEAWGGTAALVPAAARPLYHFAATLAAGGVASLLATAAELAERAGLPRVVAHGYLELARGTVAAALDAAALEAAAVIQPAAADVDVEAQSARLPAIERRVEPSGAAAAVITGPVARGDLATFAGHMQALRTVSPERLPLALELARETLRLLSSRLPAGAGQQAMAAWIEELAGRTRTERPAI